MDDFFYILINIINKYSKHFIWLLPSSASHSALKLCIKQKPYLLTWKNLALLLPESVLQDINPLFRHPFLYLYSNHKLHAQICRQIPPKKHPTKTPSPCFSLINCNLATCRTRRRNCINTSAFNVLVVLITVQAKTWRAIRGVCFARVECSHNKLSSFVLNCSDEEHAGLMGMFVYSFQLFDTCANGCTFVAKLFAGFKSVPDFFICNVNENKQQTQLILHDNCWRDAFLPNISTPAAFIVHHQKFLYLSSIKYVQIKRLAD